MTKNPPLVTVLMPVFNAKDFLRESINSILNQTYNCFEFLIINDGSTDESLEIIREFKDGRIKIVSLEKNIGIISVLNLGLEIAKGDYVARMDADDISLPQRLEKQVEFLQDNPDVGCLGTDFEWLDDPNRQSWIKYFDPVNISIALLFECAICHPTVMLRMEAIHRHKFSYPTEYVHAEDYALWVNTGQKIKLANLREVLLIYRKHEKQISATKNQLQCLSINRIQTIQLEYLQIHPTQAQLMLHSSLSGGFVPLPQLERLLSQWGNTLIEANAREKLYDNNMFKEQIHQRIKDTVYKTNCQLQSMPKVRRLHWQLTSSWRYLTNYTNQANF
jgi:hypothetical protein